MAPLTTSSVILRIVIIIAMAEFIIMLFLSALPLELDIYAEAIIDIILLVVLSTPLIYLWVIQPFVTSRNEALAHASHLAHTDPLTNLPNRRLLSSYFEKFMASSIRQKVFGAVLLLDLDGFKDLNDSYGHDAGDEVLIEVANRIRSTIRSEDVAARLGGDEFVILISQLKNEKHAAHDIASDIAEKLINQVSLPIFFEGRQLQVGASIGIRIIGMEKSDLEKMIREADTAMYNAKQAGKGRAIIFAE